MAKFFIDRPIFAIVISLMLVILGLIAGFNLPVAQYPQISPPSISVSASYMGANASVVNQTVAQIIEQKVNGVEGMDYMSSISDDTGRYGLQIVFDLATDSDMAAVKVQNEVASANASLPSTVQRTGVTTRKASNDMALIVSLHSPNKTYDRTFMKNYADIYLLDKIKRVKGVGDVNVFGADHSMRIWLEPDKLAKLNLTLNEVVAALREQNMQAPAGKIGAMPAPNSQEKQYTGKMEGRLATVEEFSNIIIRSEQNGAFVRLKDIAQIETGPSMNNIDAKTNGKPAIGFGVQLTSDANAMETVSKVQAVLKEAALDFPPDLEYREVVDSTIFIRESVSEVIHTFVEALLLVMFVVFLFLQSVRATIIPMLAIPVSLIATFGAFLLLGFSINTLTLFAMVLAIGLVVDDAIVVIENVEHHMRVDNLSPKEATKVAMDEVQGPVVAIAFVLAAVFIPVAFLGGIMGVLYKQFALTIAVSMALSAFVALTLTPALCAIILKPHKEEEYSGFLGRFFQKFNQSFDFLQNRYVKIVFQCIKRAKLAILFLLLIVIGVFFLFKTIPSTFVPGEDQGFFVTSVNLPEGTALNKTVQVMDRLAHDLKEQAGVENVFSLTGFDLLTFGAKPNAGTMFIGLHSWGERNTPETSLGALIGKVFALGAEKYSEASVIAFNPPALPGLGVSGGFTMQLLDMTGKSDVELDEIAKNILNLARTRKELQGVYTTYKINTPIYEFEIDREKAKNLGVILSDVFTAMQVNFGGMYVNDFNSFGRSYRVMLQADMKYRSAVDATKFIFVRTTSGKLVPLDTIIRPKLSTAPASISRFNGTRSITIQGSPKPPFSSGEAMQAMEEVVYEASPTGFNIDWSGQSREEKKAGSSTLKVMLLAITFVFLALAALYESFSVPYAVLFTVPTGILGALLAEYTLSLPNSIYVQIGIIMIIGLAAKNAILIVEFAKVRVDKGMNVVDAALEGAKLRLRPIIMTSFAFIVGCLPLALSQGAGAAARASMGIAVVGGMLVATILGIFLIPVFFVIVEKISQKFSSTKETKN